jgi:predicted solute-binding protein
LESLRLGCVQYLNARPLVRGLSGHVEFDHPVSLCERLANGELDVALVSSFEFLRNPIYLIVDDLAIASDGPVYSVVVARRRRADLVNIELDPASATAVAMLRCLLAERGTTCLASDPPTDKLSPLRQACGRLLIGDQAILFRKKFGCRYEYWDLGEEWRKLTKVPFVYALWLIRPEVSAARLVADRLRAVRDRNLIELETLIAAEKGFDHEFCRRYYQEHLRFNFRGREKEGLRLFHRLCAKHGLLRQREIELSTV